MQASIDEYLGLLPKLQHVIKESGKIILDCYGKKDLHVEIKSDKTPVTVADVLAHEYITKELEKISSYPIISEEDSTLELSREVDSYWLIDPLDGTKNYIARNGEFCTNIALIYKGDPVFGLINVPFFQELFYAVKQNGAYKEDSQGNKIKIVARTFVAKKPTVLVSHFHYDPKQFKKKKIFISSDYKLVHMGSALKFCRIAEGQADLYIKKGHTSSWDTAAGQCILEEAGGKVVDFQDMPLSYNSTNNQKNPFFLALGDPHIKPSEVKDRK